MRIPCCFLLMPNLRIKGWGDLCPRLYYCRKADKGRRWLLVGLLWDGSGMAFKAAVREWVLTTRVSTKGCQEWLSH